MWAATVKLVSVCFKLGCGCTLYRAGVLGRAASVVRLWPARARLPAAGAPLPGDGLGRSERADCRTLAGAAPRIGRLAHRHPGGREAGALPLDAPGGAKGQQCRETGHCAHVRKRPPRLWALIKGPRG